MELNLEGFDEYLRAILNEDIGTGDITTTSCVSETASCTGQLIAKESGVICGLNVVVLMFNLLDKSVIIVPKIDDGDLIHAGDVIATIYGNSRSILTGERTALNLLQHLSGIATKTSECVNSIYGTKTQIKDTRKTTPGLRIFEKYAVRCGGGINHRFNLADGVLIKDNHIKAAGGITNAVKMTRDNIPADMKIEVEVESLDEVNEALEAGADIIMFDNMPVDKMSEAVKIVNGRALTEASGNMGDRDLMEVAKTGVDFISIGALTHSVKSLDISLKLD